MFTKNETSFCVKGIFDKKKKIIIIIFKKEKLKELKRIKLKNLTKELMEKKFKG